MSQPLVSVILPTYNGNHEWLCEAIDSVIAQTYANRELLIINDASTNDIEKTILVYVAKDKRIQCYTNQQNMERSFTKNK